MHFPHAQSDFSPLCIQAIDQFDQRESSRSLVDDVMVKSFVHPSEIVNRTEGKSDGFVSGRVLNLKPRSRCYRNYSPLFSATIEWFVQDHRSQTRKWVFHSNEFVWICQPAAAAAATSFDVSLLVATCDATCTQITHTWLHHNLGNKDYDGGGGGKGSGIDWHVNLVTPREVKWKCGLIWVGSGCALWF